MTHNRRRLKEATVAAKVTARMVQEQASQLHGFALSDARCAELASDVERHIGAIAAAAPILDFNDEPARFTALLNRVPAGRRKRR